MKLEHVNKQMITFCAVALLFLGSLFYLVSVAFKNNNSAMASKQTRDIEHYLNDLNNVTQADAAPADSSGTDAASQ